MNVEEMLSRLDTLSVEELRSLVKYLYEENKKLKKELEKPLTLIKPLGREELLMDKTGAKALIDILSRRKT